MIEPGLVEAQQRLSDQSARLVDRLRSMSVDRLARTTDGEPSVADSAHALAQVLADLSADLEGRVRREVPRLNDLASGDQVAVTAHDLLAAVALLSTAGNRTSDAMVALNVALVALDALRERM